MKFIIGDILAYIEESIFLEELKIEDIAAHFGYDKYHFSREFKKITGFSLREYISSLKTEKAIEKIEHEERISSIQDSIGYSSLGTFSNTFKKYTGSSPKQYRQEMTELYNAAKDFEDSETNSASYFEEVSDSFCQVTIELPMDFKKGIFFIGLFHTPIPNHKPISGIATKNTQMNYLKNIPAGDYYLLVCAIDSTDTIFSYFNLRKSLRGKVAEKISFPESSGKHYTIKLRSPHKDDPPILINLVKLLSSVFKKSTI
ncbi:hypothetical protein IGI39_000532 [Enterococcus sp. AZ135]|uniref:helix-turn-helix domain-containing protein n=1 Tax=unclassified Enterococcus TaxID=2608891 RepID=UPI003F2147FB